MRKKAFQGRVQETQANGELHIRRQEEKPIDEEARKVNAELRVSEQLAVVLIESAVAEGLADACRAKGARPLQSVSAAPHPSVDLHPVSCWRSFRIMSPMSR